MTSPDPGAGQHSGLGPDPGAGPDGALDVGPAAAPPAPGPGAPVDWLLVALITLLAGWTAVMAFAFLPLYIGPVPLPVSALLGVAAMILGPRACYALTGSLVAAVLPAVAWFAVSVWLSLARSPLIGLPVTVYQGQWRVMVLLGLSALAAAATIGLLWGDRLRDRIAAGPAAQAADRGPMATPAADPGPVATPAADPGPVATPGR